MNIHRDPTVPAWKNQLRMTGICAAGLAFALLFERWNESAGLIFYALGFMAGMRYPIIEALETLRKRELDVDFLMLLVAAGAWGLGHPAEGALLLVLFTGSRAMESYAEQRTQSAIKALMADFPRTAIRVGENGEESEVDVEDLWVDDRVRIRPGETFPIDVVVEQGHSTVDLSTITGEEQPVEANVGTEVPSGAVNGQGLVTARAKRSATDSAYQKIIALIQTAPARRAPAQVLGDRAGKVFTWAILGGTLLGFVWWYFVRQLPFGHAAYQSMALLVAGSPCALVISIPSAVLAAITSATRAGILFHGGKGLLGLSEVRTVAFDKTGTLTTGEPEVLELRGEFAEDVLVQGIARELARSSTHPASGAILRYLGPVSGSRPPELEQVHEQPGVGVSGLHEDQRYHLGRRPLVGDVPFEKRSSDNGGESETVLSVGQRVLIRFRIRETPRAQATPLLERLHARGLRTMVLSGDRQPSVSRIAKLAGIDEARGELRPQDKYRLINEESKKAPIAMVGDGVNDAPALARADVGVAMGMRGSAAALAQADIVLVNDRLLDLDEAFRLSFEARRVVRQNIAIAVGAAAILVGFALAGSLPLALGVFGHEGGTVLVVLNSLRLLGWRQKASEKITLPLASAEPAGD